MEYNAALEDAARRIGESLNVLTDVIHTATRRSDRLVAKLDKIADRANAEQRRDIHNAIRRYVETRPVSVADVVKDIEYVYSLTYDMQLTLKRLEIL